MIFWTLALSNGQHQCGLGHTHLLLCSGTPRYVCLPNFKAIGARLAEYFKLEKKKTQLRSGACFTVGKDKQQHVSLQFLSQPGTANSSGRDVFAWLLKLPLSCSYSAGSGMQIPVVLLFLGLLTVPSRSQNSATEQVSRRQHAESEGEIRGAGNLILENLTEGLSTTLLSYYDFI